MSRERILNAVFYDESRWKNISESNLADLLGEFPYPLQNAFLTFLGVVDPEEYLYSDPISYDPPSPRDIFPKQLPPDSKALNAEGDPVVPVLDSEGRPLDLAPVFWGFYYGPKVVDREVKDRVLGADKSASTRWYPVYAVRKYVGVREQQGKKFEKGKDYEYLYFYFDQSQEGEEDEAGIPVATNSLNGTLRPLPLGGMLRPSRD